jgi:hypothetical protein
LQEFDPVHAWHALVGKQQRHAVIAHLQLLQEIQRALWRIASYDPVFSTVLRTEIAFYRSQNIGIVIHTKQYWFGHDRSQFCADVEVFPAASTM